MDSTNTLAKDETLPPPAMEMPSNAPAVVIDSTASSPTDNNAPSETPEDSEELHQRLNVNEDPATSESVISKYLKEVGHLKSAIGRLFTWQQKGQKEQKHEPEKTHESEETDKTVEKDTDMKPNETDGDTDPEENRSEKEENRDTERKKSETKEQEQKKVNTEAAKNVILRDGRADCAKVDTRKQRTVGMPAKGPDVREKLTEKWTPINMEFTRTIAPRQGDADHPRTAMKRRLEAEVEELDQRTEQTVTSHFFKTVQAIDCGMDNSEEPARKRQRTVSTLQELGGRIAFNPSSDEMDAEDSDGISSFGLTSSGTSTSSDESDIMHPLFDDEGADPTLYELNPDEHAFLRREAARAFARYTTATTRVRPREQTFTKEKHNLEKCRSELLRIIVMLPRKDRTTLWTNMGQPDIRALLGLLPDVPDSNEPNESNKSSLPQQAPAEVAPQGHGSTIRPCQGPLMRRVAPGGSNSKRMVRTFSEQSSQELAIVQKEDAKSSTKGILQRRLEIERQKARLAMPPPSQPIIRTKRTYSQTVNTFKMTSIASRMSPSIHSPRNIFQQGSSLRGLSSAPQGLTHRGSAGAERLAHQHYHHYYENMRRMIDTAHKTKPDAILSFSVPPHIRALEGRLTRRSDTPAGQSTTLSRPAGRSLIQTTSSWNLGSINASIPTGTKEGGLTGIKEETSRGTDGQTKRKREVTEDRQTSPADDGEQSEAKRRKM